MNSLSNGGSELNMARQPNKASAMLVSLVPVTGERVCRFESYHYHNFNDPIAQLNRAPAF